MSIWDDCRKHKAVPFYGFPLKHSIQNGVLIWYFPDGYEPDESETKEVAGRLLKAVGGELLECTDKIIRIKFDEGELSDIIYDWYMDNNIEFT